MITRRMALLLAVGFVVVASPVYAGGGGGGTKRSSTIRFVNQSSVQVGVTTNVNNAAIQAAITAGNLSQFIAAGGRVLNAGATARFSVQAGTYEVGAANVSITPFKPISESVTVSRGQTVTIFIQTAPAGGSNTIQFSSTSNTTGT
jgi:hypothetical protein